MGWSSGYESLKDLTAELRSWKTLEKVTVPGNVRHEGTFDEYEAWGVIKLEDGSKLLVCYLIQHDLQTDEWGYKEMSIDMGPYFYSVSRALVDETVIPVGTYALDWLRRYWEAQKKLRTPVETEWLFNRKVKCEHCDGTGIATWVKGA